MRSLFNALKSKNFNKITRSLCIKKGVHKIINGEDYVYVSENINDCIIYGPYCQLIPGIYEVEFYVEGNFDGDKYLCHVDVYCNSSKKIIDKKDIKAKTAKENSGKITIQFSIDQEETYEFRLYSKGNFPFNVRYRRDVRLVRYLQEDDIQKRLNVNDVNIPDVYREHFIDFEDFYRLGYQISVSEGKIVVTIPLNENSFSFYIDNWEDLFVAKEIFVFNQYNVFADNVTFDVIDIGMNVGYASLYFSSLPYVNKVYAFEPFAAPFAKATANIARNPHLAHKIVARNVGLSDHTAKEIVKTSPVDTIGISIKGRGEGEEETIYIEDAKEQLAHIIAESVAAGRKILLKIDCEGSEFAVFESLDNGQLFDHITVIMGEWHRWWSSNLTQNDLFAHLKRKNFVVFDGTLPTVPGRVSDPFLAVKIA